MADSSLSLSVYFECHDSAVTVADAGRVLLHLEAERVVRRKHCRLRTVEEMEHLVATALAYVGADIGSVERLYVGRYGNQYQSADLTLLGRAFRGTLTSHHHGHIGTVLDHGGETAIVVVADGGSEDGTTKIYFQDEDGRFTLLEDLDGTAATGKFYAALTMLTVG
jgi:predicted NodU family carbamoyl transferase